MPSLPTSASPLSRMVAAIWVKSPFSHRALLGLVVAVIVFSSVQLLGLMARSETLLTPYLALALRARSEMNS